MNQNIQRSNRLALEKSPYLLQHANNPVYWYPWGQEAFELALSQDKPIFLSIGYATCHWCHVMAKESFEDEEVAELINQTFIPVKVDREERPDIDAVYMKACHLVSGHGGWPLTVVLTPYKKPFFTATYIPKKARPPQNGLLEIIPKLEMLWKNERQKVLQISESIVQNLQESESSAKDGVPDQSLLQQAAEELRQRFDFANSGFGEAPKFPSAHNHLFLLQYYEQYQESDLLEMVEKTLRAMRLGGLFDHLGFGFHRYSTDKKWLVPHFEKMLYDQAMLALAYLRAFELTRDNFYATTVRGTLEYVQRELLSKQGVFYSGQDADSEGVEGKFYVWKESEIKEHLSQAKSELAILAFGIKEQGNFQDEATKQKTGQNILHRLSIPEKELAANLGLGQEEVEKSLEEVRKELLAARQARQPPQLDDKILTDWNGLMLAALAAAGRILQDAQYTQAAISSAQFLISRMQDKQGRLLHRYKDGEAAIPGFLDDYAFFVWGLLELYQTTNQQEYLQQASRLTRSMLKHFQDQKQGGLFMCADDAETVLYRPKEILDGAIPAGNSVALNNLVLLYKLGQGQEFREQAKALIQACSGLVQKHPLGFTHFLSGLDSFLRLEKT